MAARGAPPRVSSGAGHRGPRGRRSKDQVGEIPSDTRGEGVGGGGLQKGQQPRVRRTAHLPIGERPLRTTAAKRWVFPSGGCSRLGRKTGAAAWGHTPTRRGVPLLNAGFHRHAEDSGGQLRRWMATVDGQVLDSGDGLRLRGRLRTLFLRSAMCPQDLFLRDRGHLVLLGGRLDQHHPFDHGSPGSIDRRRPGRRYERRVSAAVGRIQLRDGASRDLMGVHRLWVDSALSCDASTRRGRCRRVRNGIRSAGAGSRSVPLWHRRYLDVLTVLFATPSRTSPKARGGRADRAAVSSRRRQRTGESTAASKAPEGVVLSREDRSTWAEGTAAAPAGQKRLRSSRPEIGRFPASLGRAGHFPRKQR
jgi:hypothetical protein